jgi:hypothetical protein
MIRDEEIKRLINYAKALGVTVQFKPFSPHIGTGALWEEYNGVVTITLFTWCSQSKTRVVLDLLHELAHHKSFIKQGRTLSNKDYAASRADELSLTKSQRKTIYKYEKEDAEYRLGIYKELDLKIPLWKLKLDIELDVWFYKEAWKGGKLPSSRALEAKRKELVLKCKPESR